MLMVASLALSSCGTVKTSTATLEAQPPASTETQVAVATPQPAPQVVKSPVVPDDPEPEVPAASGRKVPAITTASTVKAPVVADEPASPESKPVPPTPASKPAVSASATPAKPAEAPAVKPAPDKPAATEPAPVETPPAAEAPPTSITPPATAPATPPAEAARDEGADKAKPPTSIFASPSSWLKDPKALLQASIGGFPLWLVVLLVVLAFISLVIGFSGKKSPPPASAEMPAGS